MRRLGVGLGVVRRYIFAKLKTEHATGLKRVQLLQTAKEVLHAAYGVQGLHIGYAADDDTRQAWDLCITMEYVSNVDLERSSKDAVTRAFLKSFLGPRAEAVWSASFEGETVGPRRLR